MAETLCALGAAHRIAAGPESYAGGAELADTPVVISPLDCATLSPQASSPEQQHAQQQGLGPLRLLARIVNRFAPSVPHRALGAWHENAKRVAQRSEDWQPLHAVDLRPLQRLTSPIIVTWEPENAAQGPVLPAAEPCHIATLDEIGNADLDADLVTIKAPRTLAGMLCSISAVGALVPDDAASAALTRRVRADMRSIAQRCRHDADSSVPRVAVLRGLCPFYWAGGWTPELVSLAGGDALGVLPGEGSRSVDWAHIQGLQPDVLVLIVEGASAESALSEVGMLVDQPGWWMLPAVVGNAVYVVHADDMLSAGPSVVRALRTFAVMLRPDAGIDQLRAVHGAASVVGYKLAMKPHQRCRAAFLPSFFERVEL